MANSARAFLLTLIVVVVLGVVIGCSTSGSVTMRESSIAGKSIKGSVVALVVAPPGNDVAIPLRGQVASQLLGAGLFKSITDQDDKTAEYKIVIDIDAVREVSGVNRVLWGVMAGSNKITGNVTVTDVKTGQTVRAFSFIGESAAHPFSGKSDIKDAINRAAEEIMKGLS